MHVTGCPMFALFDRPPGRPFMPAGQGKTAHRPPMGGAEVYSIIGKCITEYLFVVSSMASIYCNCGYAS